jgi:hypothetical protein
MFLFLLFVVSSLIFAFQIFPLFIPEMTVGKGTGTHIKQHRAEENC